MKQTAVEWLFDKMVSMAAGYDIGMDSDEIFVQAKQMEKDQIMRAWNLSIMQFDTDKSAEQHYNETYKQ